MAPPRQSDAAPATPPAPDALPPQRDFSPLQKGGYEDLQTISGSETGRSDLPSTTELAVAAGVAAVKGYFTGNYSQAVSEMLTGLELVNPNAKPAGYDSGMMSGAGGKNGVRVNLEKIQGGPNAAIGVEQKDTTGMTETVTRIAESIKNLDSAQIAAKLKDFNKLIKSDATDGPKIVSEITNGLDKYRPEVAKRAKFNDAMAALGEDFPDSFQASQELMQAAFKMAQTGKFDRDDLASLTQAAAREFGENPDGVAAKRFRALSDQLRADYGINITIDRKGLEITNEAEGQNASMVRVDENGSMTGNIDIGPGGKGTSVPAEVALKNIMETRREQALEIGKGPAAGKILDGIGDKLKPNGEEKEGKEIPKRRPLPRGERGRDRMWRDNLV